MPERRRKYTIEFKLEAAKMVITTGRPIAEVARTTYPTREHARTAIARYIEFRYNSRRLHSALGYQTLASGPGTEHSIELLAREILQGPANTGLTRRAPNHSQRSQHLR
jgi:transposase InsO family protein